MQKLFAYVSETGALPILGEIAAPQHEFSSLKQLFTLVLEHEQLLHTKSISWLDESFVEKDYSTLISQCMFLNNTKKKHCLNESLLNLILLAKINAGFIFNDKELASL